MRRCVMSTASLKAQPHLDELTIRSAAAVLSHGQQPRLCKSSACVTDVRLLGMKFRPFCLRNGCRQNEGTLRPPGSPRQGHSCGAAS